MTKNNSVTMKKFVISLFVLYGLILQSIAFPLTTRAETKTNKNLLKITPIAECVVDNSNGFTAWFGYNNPNSTTVNIPVSPSQNKFTPAPQDRGQTTSFLPGRHRFVFSLDRSNGNLKWHLDGGQATASLNQSPRCASVEIDINAPSDNSTTLNPTTDVSGKAYSLLAGSGGITSVLVNNLPANFNSSTGDWSLSGLPLVEGENTIEVKAFDGQGNLGTRSIKVTRVDTESRLDTIDPSRVTQGQTVQITLRGRNTHWASGQTQAYFGGEISVGGGTAGDFGTVNVTDETTAVAEVTILPKAALTARTIKVRTTLQNGQTEMVKLENALTVLPVAPPGAFGNTVSTIAGSAGQSGYQDGNAGQAKFNNLAGVAVGNDDAIYVADAGNHRIRVVRQQADNSWNVQTLAGDGTAGFADGVGTQARFNNPLGIAVSSGNSIYIADSSNNRIRKIAPDGTVSTIAGDGTAGFQDGAGTTARFKEPKGIAVDDLGNVYVADTGNSAVRRINLSGVVETIAGDGTVGSNDSPNARFNGLADIAVEGQTIFIYLADSGNHRIRRLDSSGTVMTIAGAERGFADGAPTEARFAEPSGIAVDEAGRLVISDTINSLVRAISPDYTAVGSPLAVTTIAGSGERGSTDGSGNAAKFSLPRGIAITRSSAVIVADTGNHTLRRIGLPPVITSFSPTSGSVGDTITIYGENFDQRGNDKNTVTFAKTGGGTITASVTNVTNTQLTVVVPNEAATGKITVTTQDGTVTSIDDFQFVEAFLPEIADFTPRRGQVGTAVKLLGTNLKTSNATPVVTFAGSNNTRLNALVNSSTELEVNVLVPNGAVTGRIELTNSFGSAQTSQDFVVDETQEFQVNVSPSTVEAVERTKGNAIVSLTSSNSTFTQLAALTAINLPSGVIARFEPAQITAGGTSTLELDLGDSSLSSGSHQFTVRATAIIDGQNVSRDANASLSILTAGQTTLSGRVLNTDSEPVIGATVSLDGITSTTDSSGSFLLSGVTAGQSRPLQIDGRTANAPNRTYPVITEPADVVAGQANQAPFIFYLPPIDTQYEVSIIPGQSAVVGNPRVPGLQMTIPANANLRNRDGTPVIRASITPLAIDRTPAPLPSNVATGLVYTSQPGGALTDVPIPVIYPNLLGDEPGTILELYAFNHDTVDWYIYGYGKVSPDGKTIEPEIDPNTGSPYGLLDFSWHLPNGLGNGGNSGGGGGDSCPDSIGKNPVDFSTGLKFEDATDISFGSSRGGITISRSYSSENSALTVVGRFGPGWKDNFEFKLSTAWAAGGFGRVIRPDERVGRLFSFSRTDEDGSLVFNSRETVGQLADTVRKLTDGTFEYRYGNGMLIRFDSTGRMTAMVDRNGNTTTLSYAGDNLSQITDAVGRTVIFEYDGSGKVTKITDPLNRSWTYGYSTALVPGGILDSVTDPLGNVTRYNYKIVNGIRLSSITDPKGNLVKQIAYSPDGRVKSQTFADGGIETYEYQTSGRIITQTLITDPLGRKKTKRFNANGYVIEQVDELGQKSIISRNLTNNLPNSTVGSCGCAEETRKFDERGNATEVTDQEGNTTKIEYEPIYNNITKVTDKLNRQTTFAFNTNGDITSITDTLGRTSSMVYDQFGRVISSTDPLNQTETYEYDANGYITASIDKLGKRWELEYDTIGNLQSQTDPLGRTISYTYDDLDRLITITDPNNAVTTFVYDANSNRISVKDALNRVWTMSYDSKNRPFKATDPIGRISKTEYDKADQVTKMISPSGRQMRYEYDKRGQVIEMIDGLNNTVELSYDYEQKLKSLKNERGYLTTFEYDELDRPISQRNPLGQTSSVKYDALGKMTEAIDELGRVTTLNYDIIDRLQSVNYADAQVSYIYDDLNRPTQVTDTQGGIINWTYDANDQVLSETTDNGVVSYSYNDAKQKESMTVQGRQPVNYNYDSAGRLGLISQGAETFTYSYDILSRILSMTRPNGVTTSYEYNEVNRLKRLTHASSSQTIEDLQYSYNTDDEISSISSLQYASALPPEKTASIANEANRISQIGDFSYSFDAKGQTTTRTDSNGTAIYNWDARGRMTSATLPNGNTVTYQYDAVGRRSSRTANNQKTNFVYDDNDVIQDKTNLTVEADYINGLGIDDKLRVSNSNGSLYFLKDHLGSTQGLTGVSGNVAEWQQYEVFGNSSIAGSLTRYSFTGREKDNETGLIYYRARWYDTQQGRFISQDPVKFLSGTNNFFEYASNSPLNYSDPLGLWVYIVFYRTGGNDPNLPNGGGKIVVYDMDSPPQYVWVPSNSTNVKDPVGDYQWQYKKVFELDTNLFSGVGDCKNNISCQYTEDKGPIPSGDFAIFGDPKGRGWYSLYRKQSDKSYRDRGPVGNNGASRGEFRLHPGMVSIGCLTFKGYNNADYKRLSNILKNTSKIKIKTGSGKQYGFGYLRVY